MNHIQYICKINVTRAGSRHNPEEGRWNVTDLNAAEVGDLADGGADGALQVAVPGALAHGVLHGSEQAGVGGTRLALHSSDEAVRHGAHRGIGIRDLCVRAHMCVNSPK